MALNFAHIIFITALILMPIVHPEKSKYHCNDTLSKTKYSAFWPKYSDKIFRSQAENLPRPVSKSLQNQICDQVLYSEFSPIAYIANPTGTSDKEHYEKVEKRQKDIAVFLKIAEAKSKNDLKGVKDLLVNSTDETKKLFSKWEADHSTEFDTPPGRDFEKKLCYVYTEKEPFETLECNKEGKCVCPTSGRFQKLAYISTQHVNHVNGTLIPDTITCASDQEFAYCIRISSTCHQGRKCVFNGALRDWPFNCVLGVCRGQSAIVKPSFNVFNFVIIVSLICFNI